MTDGARRLARRRAFVDVVAIAIGVAALVGYVLLGVPRAPVLAAYGLLWGTSTAVVTYALSRFTGINVGAPDEDAHDTTEGEGIDGHRRGVWGIFAGTALETEAGLAEDTGWLIGRLENVIVLTLVLLGEYTALSIVFAAKAWVRSEDTSTEDTTYYLAGTLVNVTYSIAIGLVTLWLLGPPF